jgi:ribosomal protein L9
MREGEELERVMIIIETNEGTGFTSSNQNIDMKDPDALKKETAEALASMIYTMKVLAEANGQIFGIVTERGIIL